MKKIILVALITIGFMTMNYAQTLTYKLMNSSMSTWDFKLIDAGSGDTTFELGISPGKSRTGVVPGFSFPMEIKVENSAGCGTSKFISRPTPTVYEQINCEENAEIKYRVVEVIPFLAWRLELSFG